MNNPKPKYGILLLNMGGPNSIDEVENYIYSLMADPLMIRIPLGAVLQKPFARMISRKRAPKVIKRYELIGGKSPIEDATRRQSEALSNASGLSVAFAMRYTPPSVSDALAILQNSGCTRLIVIPLYPQYSTVSTLSSIRDFENQIGDSFEYRIIDRHFNNPNYINAMRQLLLNAIGGVDLSLKTHILFAAHSIPEPYIRAGDPYADEVEETARAICNSPDVSLPYSLAYQSRVGPVKWRGPALDEELKSLLSQGIEQLIVQPLSFVSENLETLFDLDIDFKETCRAAGIRSYIRVNTPDNMPKYINAIADMTASAIEMWEAAGA